MGGRGGGELGLSRRYVEYGRIFPWDSALEIDFDHCAYYYDSQRNRHVLGMLESKRKLGASLPPPVPAPPRPWHERVWAGVCRLWQDDPR
jgi:hypothetical protein